MEYFDLWERLDELLDSWDQDLVCRFADQIDPLFAS
jgi:hypothetical protein